MAWSDYYDMLNAIEKYYGSGSDQWAEIAKYGIASEHAEQILRQVPGVTIIKNANGTIRSYNFNACENIVSNAEHAVNSNVPAVIKSFDVPANTGIETIASPTGEAVKQMTFKSGLSTAGRFVFGEVAPRIAAVATGITLGKTIDKLLYNVNPDFWDEHGMETVNPDKWGEIIGTDSTGARVANVILGTTPDGDTQAYIDQDAFAYMVAYLNNKNVFAKGGETYSKPQEIYKDKFFNYNGIKDLTFYNIPSGTVLPRLYIENKPTTKTITVTDGNPNIFLFSNYVSSNEDKNYLSMYAVSDSPFRITVSDSSGSAYSNDSIRQTAGNDSKNTFYRIVDSAITNAKLCNGLGIMYTLSNVSYKNQSTIVNDIYALTKYGTHDIEHAIEGIGNQDGAKTPDLSGANSVDDVLNKLKIQYPDLWDNAVNHDVVQPDGSVKTYTYVPVAMPELDKDGNPVSSSSNQATPQINPATATESLIGTITDLLSKIPPVNPPATGSGGTPVVPPVTGKATALYSIYNPTLEQINSLGAWLWSSNFIDQLLKLFSSPMDAIIGLHKIYATPATGGAQNIRVGYLDSGVSSRIVTEQYSTVDCGTVNCYEYFGNVLDYNPYTNIRLYLPFIGIIDLSNSDVMRSSVNVVYHVDVLTGACLAEVKITRDGGGGTLYQYAGNAATTLPISSGSYMGVISSVSSVATRALVGFASGGALGAIASGATGILNAQGTNVVHSGGFSGNAGAMGCKKPYLIIERPQTETANNTAKLLGYGSNLYTELNACKGFTTVKAIHVDTVTTATENEKNLIEQALKQGVIIK